MYTYTRTYLGLHYIYETDKPKYQHSLLYFLIRNIALCLHSALDSFLTNVM